MARQTNIRRRGNSWVVNLRVNGEKVWRSFPTRDAAELFLERIRAERRNGTYRAPVKVTFRVAAEAWHEHGVNEGGRRGPWKATTLRDYRSVLDVHLLPAFGELQLADVTADRIAAWRRERMRSGKLPRRTAEKVVAVLHGIFERARREYAFPANPVADVERLAMHYGTAIDFYSPEEVWALVRAAGSTQDAALFLTAAFTGLRRGELVALQVRAVDFANSSIRVEGSFAGGELSTPKSGNPRAVPMVPEVATALSRLLDERGDPSGEELVFPGDGGYLDASALRRRYAATQKRAKLRTIRFHDLRHTFGSLAINRASIVQVQAWMGHADVKTTMRYLHHKSQAGDAQLLAGAFEPNPVVMADAAAVA
jgi:integrase